MRTYVLRYTDISFPNQEEARRLTGRGNAREAARVLAALSSIVAMKLGTRGAWICSGKNCFFTAGVTTRAVDTTGAGDSFNVGFLSQWVRGATLEQCVQAGVAAGARYVTMFGGAAAFGSKR